MKIDTQTQARTDARTEYDLNNSPTSNEIREKALKALETADAAFFVIATEADDEGVAISQGVMVGDDLPDDRKANVAISMANSAMELADDVTKRAILAGIMANLGGDDVPTAPTYGDDSEPHGPADARAFFGGVAALGDDDGPEVADPAYY